ncbi:MAG: methyltransferase domain-containing protein [Proteobacteria bacterium]|nr:methyltransferase domain-containing protein [Pseudomonadota bacterium]
MLNRRQQQEALNYFRGHAQEWSNNAAVESLSSVNIIKQRNDYVLHVIQRRQSTRVALDVGCGTGELVLDVARMGVRSIGVDFAPEMIKIGTQAAVEEKLDQAHFHCESIFEFDMSQPTYDCISANGFIEYISCEQLLQFIALSYQALNKDGSLVMGSRNRLFNLF